MVEKVKKVKPYSTEKGGCGGNIAVGQGGGHGGDHGGGGGHGGCGGEYIGGGRDVGGSHGGGSVGCGMVRWWSLWQWFVV